MQEVLRQATIDRQYYNLQDAPNKIDAIIDYYVNVKGVDNKMISHIIHDIWRFGEGQDQHFLFEARLLTRSVWDLVAKAVILPSTGQVEVFTPRITKLVSRARSFRDLVQNRLDETIILSEREAQSFGNMVRFLRELTKVAALDELLKTFAPHFDNADSAMSQSQVALSSILVNLGVSDIQFAKGIIIAAILVQAMEADDVDQRTPFELALSVIRAFQQLLSKESINSRQNDFKYSTIIRKTVRKVQPSEWRFINAAYGDHMEWGYPQKLAVSKQYQFDVTQDFNKIRGEDQPIAYSLVRMVRDRITAQMNLYIGNDRDVEGLELSVIVGMIIQIPQNQDVQLKNQSSESLIHQVGDNLRTAQVIIGEQITLNEGWSKYVTISMGIMWQIDQEEVNSEELRSAILKNIEFLVNRYGGDEYAEMLITSGIDRAILRKLNVRPMVYIQGALKRPELVARLDNDMSKPNIAVTPTPLHDIQPSLNKLILTITGDIADNQRYSEAYQLRLLSARQEAELDQAEHDEEEQDAADYRLQLADERDELEEIYDQEAEDAWQKRQVEDQQELDEAFNIQQQTQGPIPLLIEESDIPPTYWKPMDDGDDQDEDFGFIPKKKPKYFGASRLSDILFEEHFKLQPSTNANCVINTCQALIQVFPDSGFAVTEIFIDLFAQIYEKTPLIEPSLRNQLVICEYENCDIISTIEHILANKHLQVIIFFRQGHVFPSIVSQIQDKQSIVDAIIKGVNRKAYEPLTFKSRITSVRKGLGGKQSKAQALKELGGQTRTNVYFDFETTLCDDPHKHQFRGLQQAFLVSITVDIFIPLQAMGIIIFGEQVPGVQDVQLFIPFELIWGLDCDVLLLQRFADIQEFIRDGCLIFNDTIDQRQLKDRKMPDIFNAISFNGSKFDNQFVVKGLIKVYNSEWYKHVNIVGDLNDIKVMTHKGIVFMDLRLMCGASSLEQFCKDMQIDLASSKKKIDYAKMKTFQIATINRQEIESYCAHDTISLRELHVKVQISLRNLLVDFIEPRSETSRDQIFLNTSSIFQGWTTISQLSLKIFRNIFCDIEFRATRNHAVMSIYRDSYKGGYTQSFILGQTPKDTPVFYMDFNSMYPFIMASTPFPTDMSKAELVQRPHPIILSQKNFHKITRLRLHQQTLAPNPTTKTFNLNIYSQHFDVFLLTGFEFAIDCKAPSFGVVVKGRGTIYPRTFSSLGQDCVSVFGFQLQENFNSRILVSVTYSKSVEFVLGEVVARPIFKTFDDFMFEARARFKASKNTSMSTAVKLLINSLYGKFGQRQHDVEFFASSEDIDDDEKFESLLRGNTIDRDDIQLTPQGVVNGSVRIVPLADINGTPLDVSRIILSGTESLDNDVGSFVLIASLITAIGRQMITNIINTVKGIVYYSDTDSVMMNQEAFTSLCNDSLFEVSDTKFGALKNEYPLNGNSNTSAITQIRVLNKKIYQLNVNGEWISKFKGCTNPTNDLFDSFMNDGIHVQDQTRFIKNTASISIQERRMNYRLRLSRQVIQAADGDFSDTKPFEDVEQYQTSYPSSKNYIQQVQGEWVPYTIS